MGASLCSLKPILARNQQVVESKRVLGPGKWDPLLRAEKEIKKFITQSKFLHQFSLKAGIIFTFVFVTTFILTLERASREETIPIQKVSSDNFSPSLYKKQ